MKAPLVIIVPGPPVGKQRPRMNRWGRMYTPPETLNYERHVADIAQIAMLATGWTKTNANVRVWVHAYVPDLRRRDLDNIQKAAWDALNDVVWEDDVQVIEGHEYKKLDRENPRLVITVEKDDE